jgi:small-conductance mechanosensitive channel
MALLQEQMKELRVEELKLRTELGTTSQAIVSGQNLTSQKPKESGTGDATSLTPNTDIEALKQKLQKYSAALKVVKEEAQKEADQEEVMSASSEELVKDDKDKDSQQTVTYPSPQGTPVQVSQHQSLSRGATARLKSLNPALEKPQASQDKSDAKKGDRSRSPSLQPMSQDAQLFQDAHDGDKQT